MKALKCISILVAIIATLCGVSCGGGSSPSKGVTPIPQSASLPEYQPNYAFDLDDLLHWGTTEVTYRIALDGGASDLDGTYLPSVVPTGEQVSDIQSGLDLWRSAIGRDRISFRELPADDEAAQITYVLQTDSDFKSGIRGSLGNTKLRIYAEGSQVVRAVSRIRASLNGDEFAWVSAHETGHALGIHGHSHRATGDLMCANRVAGTGLPKLSDRDSNTIDAAYIDK